MASIGNPPDWLVNIDAISSWDDETLYRARHLVYVTQQRLQSPTEVADQEAESLVEVARRFMEATPDDLKYLVHQDAAAFQNALWKIAGYLVATVTNYRVKRCADAIETEIAHREEMRER